MPYYQKRGDLPRKRHMQFRNAEGELYPEHLVGNKGFVGISSLLHHLRPPTTVKNVDLIHEYNIEADINSDGGNNVLDIVELVNIILNN